MSVTSIDPVELRVAAAPAQTISSERAASFVASDMWLDYGTGLCQPDGFDRRWLPASAKSERQDPLLPDDAASRLLDADPEGEHVPRSAGTSPPTTGRNTTGTVQLHPAQSRRECRLLPALHRSRRTSSFLRPARWTSTGISTSARPICGIAPSSSAPVVIVEDRADAVRLWRENGVHISEVDFVIEGDRRRPAAELPNPPVRESTRRSGGASPPRSRMVTACRSGSAPCRTPCARCSSKAGCGISASTPR